MNQIPKYSANIAKARAPGVTSVLLNTTKIAAGHHHRITPRPIVATETIYTLIATPSCDQVCNDFQLLL